MLLLSLLDNRGQTGFLATLVIFRTYNFRTYKAMSALV